ncbi:hypothetical protein CHARACLAT_010121, partial [Characodon lateralis]|nr:hypothetical protein [Characodon lateralis]
PRKGRYLTHPHYSIPTAHHQRGAAQTLPACEAHHPAQTPSRASLPPSPQTGTRKEALVALKRTRTMEGAANSSDLQSQLPFINQNNSFCRNLTDNTSFSERRCGDGGLTNRVDEDANPVIIAIIITALYSIVCMVGLVGNVLVMYIIVR